MPFSFGSSLFQLLLICLFKRLKSLDWFLLTPTDFDPFTFLYVDCVQLVLLHCLLLLQHLCFNFLILVMLLHLRLPVTLLCFFFRSDTLGNSVDRFVNVVKDCLLLCLRYLALCLFHGAAFFLC